jgi:hypothetical protein
MTRLNFDGRVARDAGRVRDSTARLVYSYALSVAICTSLSVLAHAETPALGSGLSALGLH